jgi:excisionase family DNA binding protein
VQDVNLESYPDLLTVPEVAAILRVDRSYVYRLIREGRLVVLRLTAHKTRVPKCNLRLLLDSARTDGRHIQRLPPSVPAETP